MSTNPPEHQRVYQRQHRERKQIDGICAENGCQIHTTQYRCESCRERHAQQERTRQQARIRCGCEMDEALIREIMECKVRVWLARKRRAAYVRPLTSLEKKRLRGKRYEDKKRADAIRLGCWGKV